MVRWAVLGCMVALCSAGAAASAASGPGSGAAVAVERQVVLVSGGCGPYGFRGYYGYCRPRRVYAPPPRRFYGCPYGFRPTPFGCRPFY